LSNKKSAVGLLRGSFFSINAEILGFKLLNALVPELSASLKGTLLSTSKVPILNSSFLLE